jgi:pyruvate carboxylase
VKLNRLEEDSPEVKRNWKEEERKQIEEEEHRLVERNHKKEEKERLEHSKDWVTDQFDHMQHHKVAELIYPPPICDYSNNITYHETYNSPPSPSF